jgi:hypothetical protein
MRFILHLRDLRGEKEKSSLAYILRRIGHMRSRFEEDP